MELHKNDIQNIDQLKFWSKKLFLAKDEYDLMFDLDERYLLNQSLLGSCSVGLLDIMMVSFLRRSHQLTDIPDTFTNLKRVFDHISTKFQVGFSSMDKKEHVMYQEISKLSNCKEFVEAMSKMDIR